MQNGFPGGEALQSDNDEAGIPTCGNVRQGRLHAVVVVLQVAAIAEEDVLLVLVGPAQSASI